MPRHADDCPHRSRIESVDPNDRSSETAHCGLIATVADFASGESATVDRETCHACCQSFVPSPQDWNPVIASIIHSIGETLLQSSPDGPIADQARRLCRQAIDQLPIVYPDEDDCVDDAQIEHSPVHVSVDELAAALPIPIQTKPPADPTRGIRWTVGMTTAPRRQPTLTRCIQSITASGWQAPMLFVDGEVELTMDEQSQVRIQRPRPIGAWPAWCETLRTMLSDAPDADADADADAVMIVQDDVLFPAVSSIREYVEMVLWPQDSAGIVSLYTSTEDMQSTNHWRPHPGLWQYGALAMIFPTVVARQLLNAADRGELNVVDGNAGIDTRIGYWAIQNDIPIWHPSPSLVQHIGQVSSVWNHSRAVGLRRADRFIMDELASGPKDATGQ
ncbi:hypothetical protein K227x_11810 [Rubripirellula lacrimiformis]|uniref:Glycosyltransferase family 25 (LPS biosynthesis protein) n=1 Tax=Rubripirellula lacrimiformis TaxID=1930273 RepID=A0A517N6N3_9BACT|nr:hypothetical protein [Rubripirellula lacrimiformis]QDT02803.1 hypothetical protein K227x_11810 [Rubripirellula lacrimiformis]